MILLEELTEILLELKCFYLQINLGIYMKDNSNEFSILVDRSVGGSSITDGQLELMVHRLVFYAALVPPYYIGGKHFQNR